LLCVLGELQAAEKAFTLSGANLTLEEVSNDIEVRYRSMRLNRAQNVWNVEAVLTNKSSRVVQGPFVLSVEGFTGTTGPLQPDGLDNGTPAKAFFDFSAGVADGALSPGRLTLERTLTLGVGVGAPSLVTKVFASPNRASVALGLVRSLNDAGEPLASVQIEESGPVGQTNLFTDPVFGVATVGQGAGSHTWKFGTSGYLPVWRQQNLTTNGVAIIASPRLTRRGTNVATITLLDGGQVRDPRGSVQISFPPGAVTQNTTATLTPVTGQTLPALLPLGWSPLQAFWLELTGPVSTPATALLRPSGQIGTSETVALVRLNENTAQWEAVQSLAGNGTNAVSMVLNSGGAYALVIGDAPPQEPPPPQVGQPLQRVTVSLPDSSSLTAGGTVYPPSSPASRTPELVTGIASVIVTNSSGPLPSGLVLRCEVFQNYRLRDGTTRHPPQFENFVIGYQRPGDTNPSTLHASFPLRPMLLFGSEELDEATVKVDVLTPTPFTGSVYDARGGQVSADALRVLAGSGDVTGQQAAQLRRLNPTNFLDLVSANVAIISAFELTVAGIAPGRHLVAQTAPLPTNGVFVLARVIYDQGQYGLQPLERLATDSLGKISSVEPGSGDRLGGVIGSGQYVLAQLDARQGLVTGIARNSSGQPTADMPVRIAGQPWLALSGADGSFKLLAPTGSVDVAVTDLTTGDTGETTLVVTDPNTTANTSLASAAAGPRVISINPTNNAVNVSRVTPIEIVFSEPVNPGTLLGNAIQLLGTNAQPVAASLTLNLRNTVATLLPNDPLESGVRFTVALATNISDRTGLRLEGQNQFTFETQKQTARADLAKLTIFQPGATNLTIGSLDVRPLLVGLNGAPDKASVVAAYGSPGTAEAGVPVVLVNEASGETATVLSRPDGSFGGFVHASEEDFISAAFVNANGTRTTVSVSEQRFDDGSVGLYNAGGILEAQSDGGPVQVIVKPGSIPERTKFKVEPVGLATLLAVMNNVQPQDGRLLERGISISVSGDRVRGEIDVAIPLSDAELLRAGVTNLAEASQAVFALAVPTTVDGDPAYLEIDKMQYANGRLETHSPPFQGAGLVTGKFDQVEEPMEQSKTLLRATGPRSDPTVREFAVWPLILAPKGLPVLFTGQVFEAQQFTLGAKTFVRNKRPLPGAMVTVRAAGAGLFGGRPGRLDPGTVYTLSDAEGTYALVLPMPNIGNPLNPDSSPEEFALAAQHPKYFGFRVETPPAPQVFSARIQDLIFLSSGERPINANPPSVAVTHTPGLLARGGTAQLVVLASHSSERPTVLLPTLDSIVPLVSGGGGFPSSVSIRDLATENIGATTVRRTFGVTCAEAALVKLRIEPTVSVAPPRVVIYPLNYGGAAIVAPNVISSDDADTVGPRVLRSQPQTDPAGHAAGLAEGEPIVIEFSEAVDRALVGDPAAVTLTPDAGSPEEFLSDDQRTLTLRFPKLEAGRTYTLTLTKRIVDISLSHNPLDQDPLDGIQGDSFHLSFRVASRIEGLMSGISYGGGAVLRGIYAYVLERTGPLDGAVLVYDLSDPKNPVPAGRLSVPGFPRDLALIPQYSFVRKPGDPVETKDLLAVVGGKLGGTSDGLGGNLLGGFQYLWIIDISNPDQPARVAAAEVTFSGATAVTKVQWTPPMITYLEAAADVQSIGVVNLQSFIIGSYLHQGQFTQPPSAGVDLNGDGDFVDPDEELPFPSPDTDEFAGKVASFILPDTNQRILDYSFNPVQGYLGLTLAEGRVLGPDNRPTSTVAQPAYRTLEFGFIGPNRSSASIEYPGMLPKRLFVLPGASVVVTGQVQVVNLALVSLDPAASGAASLDVLDITDPTLPKRLQTIPIPPEHGLVQSVTRRDDGMLLLATSQDVLLVDPRRLADPMPTSSVIGALIHPALVGAIPGMGSGARTFDGISAGLTVVSLGGKNLVRQTAPRLFFAAFPHTKPFSPTSIQNNQSKLDTALSDMALPIGLPVARFRTIQGYVDATLSPPSPLFHYYVLVLAPGSAGDTIDLTLESLNESGFPLRNKGIGFPPVRAMGTKGLQGIDQEPRQNLDAEIHVLTAYRLTTNKTHPYYNIYLSKPFALVYEPMTLAELSQAKSNPNREIIWSGHFLRAYLDPGIPAASVLADFRGSVDSAEQVVLPGPSVMLRSFPADYILGPNPGWPLGWAYIPGSFKSVPAHNGEIRIETQDIALPSPRMPIQFKRSSGSQDFFDGPFGRGWDFNYNQRLVQLESKVGPGAAPEAERALTLNLGAIPGLGLRPSLFDLGVFAAGITAPQVIRKNPLDEVASPPDVLFYNGNARVLIYKFAGTNPPPEFQSDALALQLNWFAKGLAYYHSPTGCFDMLMQFQDKRFARLTPDGTQFWYSPAGRLESIYNRYTNNVHRLFYDARGELARIQDGSVTADRYLDIGYYRAQGQPFLTAADVTAQGADVAGVGKIARLVDYTSVKRDVLFHYSKEGTLILREGVKVTFSSPFRQNSRQQTHYLWGPTGNNDLQSHPTANGLSGVIGDPGGVPWIKATSFVASSPVPVIKSFASANGAVDLDVLYNNTAEDLAAGNARVQFRPQSDPAQSQTTMTLSPQGYPQSTEMSGRGASQVTYSTTYNTDGLPLITTYPLGNSIQNTYELAPVSRRNAANLKFVDRLPNDNGPTLHEELHYEAVYNLRDGNQLDVNGNTVTYTLTIDGKDVGRVEYPPVNVLLPPGAPALSVGAGAFEEFFYNSSGQLERQVDVNGLTHRSEYDGPTGFLRFAIHGLGNEELRTEYVYNGPAPSFELGLPGTRIHPRVNSEQTHFTYDEREELIEMKRGQIITTFEHDDDGRVRRQVNTVDTGKTVEELLDYELNGFLKSRTLNSVETGQGGNLAQLKVEYLPDGMWRVQKVVYNQGTSDAVTREFFDYDHLGRPGRMTLGDYQEAYTYDDNNNVTEIRRGNAVTHYVFDGHDRLEEERTRVRGTAEEKITRHYFNSGELREITVQDAQGNVNHHCTYQIDALLRTVASITDTDSGPSVQLTRYDGNSRTRQIASPAREVSTIRYNTAGQPINGSDSVRILEFTHDKNNNLEKTISREGANGQQTFTTEHTPFDGMDRTEQLKDDEGIVSRFTRYRLDGKLLEMRDGRNLPHTYDYTRLGEPSLSRRPSGVEFRYAYDLKRNRTREEDIQNKGWKYDYDDTQRLERHTLRDQKAFKFSQFEPHNQPRQTEYPELSPDLVIASDYDLKGRQFTNTTRYLGHVRVLGTDHDGLDRPRAVTFSSPTLSGAISYRYDLLGPLRQVDTTLKAHSFTVRHDVRPDGARTNVAYPTVSVAEDRDLNGRLLSLRPVSGDPIVSLTTFATANLIGTRTFGNGLLSCANQFDGRQRLLHRTYTGPGGKVLAEIHYGYDSNNNVVARQALDRGGRADFFQYDADNRLVRADTGVRPTLNAAASRSLTGFAVPPGLAPAIGWAPGRFARSYTYDQVGRLDLLTGSAPINPDNFILPPFAASIGNVDAALFARDVDGFTRDRDSLANTTRTVLQVRPPGASAPEAVPATVTYDGNRQLIRIQRDDGVEVQYDYLPSGYCSYRKVSGPLGRCVPSERMFVWDGWRLIEEYDVTASTKTLRARYYYTASDAPIAADVVDATGIPRRHYFLLDMQGSLLALVNGAGDVVERYAYDAWGEPQIEPADSQPPVIKRIVTANDGLLIEFSERVLPPLLPPRPGASPKEFQAAFADFTSGLTLEQGGAPLPGSFTYEESRPGFAFGTVIRFQPGGGLGGNLILHISAGTFNDEWNNPTAAASVNFLFDPTPGTTLFQDLTPTAVAPAIRTAFDQPFLFHGQYFDLEAGLSYMRARFYDPFTGLFLQADPDGYAASVNPYVGLGNNPQSLRDPSGENPVAIAVGALIGGAVNAAIELGDPDATGQSVGAAFLGGAVEGAIIGFNPTTTGFVGGAIARGVIYRALDGKDETQAFDSDALLKDVVFGAVAKGGAQVMGLVAGKLGSLAAKTAVGKYLGKDIGVVASDLLSAVRSRFARPALRAATESTDDLAGAFIFRLDPLEPPPIPTPEASLRIRYSFEYPKDPHLERMARLMRREGVEDVIAEAEIREASLPGNVMGVARWSQPGIPIEIDPSKPNFELVPILVHEGTHRMSALIQGVENAQARYAIPIGKFEEEFAAFTAQGRAFPESHIGRLIRGLESYEGTSGFKGLARLVSRSYKIDPAIIRAKYPGFTW
jgi:RHS repeat-associated protein